MAGTYDNHNVVLRGEHALRDTHIKKHITEYADNRYDVGEPTGDRKLPVS